MLIQLLNDEHLLFLAVNFFLAGLITGILIMRVKLSKLKKKLIELDEELQKQYDDKLIHMKE